MRCAPGLVGFGAVAVAVASLGCNPNDGYEYRPAQNANAGMATRPDARYSIPPETPHGRLEIASLGITTVEPRPGTSRRAMHVRMTLDDRDSAAWTLDTRQQIGVLEGYGMMRPVLAQAQPGIPPIVAVSPSSRATIDLYYVLPREMQTAEQVRHFDVIWRVDAADREVADRTDFDRVEAESSPEPIGRSWLDPAWPDDAVAGPLLVTPPKEERSGVTMPQGSTTH